MIGEHYPLKWTIISLYVSYLRGALYIGVASIFLDSFLLFVGGAILLVRKDHDYGGILCVTINSAYRLR